MKRNLIFIFLASMIVMSGCATAKSTRPGFLKDYGAFAESQGYSGMLVDNRNLSKLSDYNKYLIDPVVMDFAANSRRDQVPQAFAQEVADYFHVQIVNGLKDKYQIADASGPGVLRIRLAITDIDQGKSYLDSAFSSNLAKAGAGGASMEAEAVDSVSGERIVAVIDCRKASEWDINNGLAEWGFAKDVCADWAKMFRERLDTGYKDVVPEASNTTTN